MKELLVRVNVEEVIEFVANGQNCKAEIESDGNITIIPQNAEGYDDIILTLNFDAEDYDECESEEEYKEFLKDNYKDIEIETDDYLVKVEF